MRRMIILAALYLMVFGAQSQASPPAYIQVDTLKVDIKLGQHGQQYDIDSLASDPHLQMLVRIVNNDSTLMLGVETNANHVKWIPAKKNNNISAMYDGGVTGRRSMFVTELVRRAGLNDLHNDLDIIELPVVTPLPFIKFYLVKKDCTCPPVRETKKDTVEVHYFTSSVIEAVKSTGLGIGFSSSPFNGLIFPSLNVKWNMNGDSTWVLKLGCGYSFPGLNREVSYEGGYRETHDFMIQGTVANYPWSDSELGFQIGVVQVENIISNGKQGGKYYERYRGITLGIARRMYFTDTFQLNGNLSASYGYWNGYHKDLSWNGFVFFGAEIWWR